MGGISAVLTALGVESWTVDEADEGTVIRGRAILADFQLIYIPPMNLSVIASVGQLDDGARDDWFDIRDTHIDFQLLVPREASAVIAAAPPGAAAAFFSALDPVPGDAPPSDYPDTNFTLDLLLTSVVLRPPMLKPAMIAADGTLRPDPSFRRVEFTLPRLKLRVAQPSGPATGPVTAGAPLTIDLLSLGASGLDDPGAEGVADLIEMTPPYALIGDKLGLGFGFRGAILDLSDGATPAAVLAQFGFDERWKGLYLPEIRLYYAQHGMEGIALTGVARNLLIGFGDAPGITGDFEVSVIEQGEGTIDLSARFLAPGRQAPYGITFTDPGHTKARAAVPEDTLLLVDIAGGRSPYTPTISINGTTVGQRSAEIKAPPTGSVTVHIDVNDSSTPSRQAGLDIEVSRLSTTSTVIQLPGKAAPPGPVPDAVLTNDAGNLPSLRIELVRQTVDSARLTTVPPDPVVAWASGGLALGAGAEMTVGVKAGQTVEVTATRHHPSTPEKIDVFYHYDHPTQPELEAGYAADPTKSHSTKALDELPAGEWTFGGDAIDTVYGTRLDALPNGTKIPIVGYASFEGDESKDPRNQLLSERRAKALSKFLAAHYSARAFDLSDVTGNGCTQSKIEYNASTPGNRPPRNQWWKAVMALPGASVPDEVAKATLTRDNPAPGTVTPGPVVIVPPPETKAADPPEPPDWFHSAALKIRFVRGDLIALEVDTLVDFETGLESRMKTLNPPPDKVELRRLDSNSADGLTRMQWIVQRDPATDRFLTKVLVGADPADRDGLLAAGWLPDEARIPPSFGRDYLGLTAALLPLLSNVVPPMPKNGAGAIAGDAATMAAVFGVPAGIAALNILHVERIILHGVEAVIEDRADGMSVSYLFDVEVAISGDLLIAKIKPERPLSVRYKAVGVRMGKYPGEQQAHLLPVFDASRGYSIDVSGPGVIEVPAPLGNILKVLGARIARTNPLSFEVDIGMAADLGVVTVDRARVRVRLDEPALPELTALGVGIDVPGALLGHGALEINNGGFAGKLDVTLRPIGLRIAAGLALNDVTGPAGEQATGVFVTLDVAFPVPIPLWTSGLGIYGFLGLFAMHYRRNTQAKDAAGTLKWLKDNDGVANNPLGWTADYGHWGFGLGTLLGTMDGGILFNLKGVLLLELPGPNILLTMKARLLSPMPEIDKDTVSVLEALAVIDIDVDAGKLSIGLVLDYEIKWLVKLHVPVSAVFHTNKASEWAINLGEYPPDKQVHAEVFHSFDGSGYLMLSGNGLALPNLDPVTGFAVGAGLHIALTWGPVEIGLYARVGGGMDAVVGFDPFRFEAKLTLNGELRLFIVSVGAHTDLTVKVGELNDGTKVSKIDGDICGSVDCWFFEVEGCVGFHLGDDSAPQWNPPALVQSLELMSRSPALVAGTALDRPIDAKLPPGPVPIDSIPVLMMVAPPAVFANVLDGTPDGTPGGGPGEFIKMGNDSVRYELQSVEISPPIDGAKPSVWWTRDAPTDPDRGIACQLAMLTWTPTAISKAIESSDWYSKTVKDRWGTACTPPAPPAPVLWTFEHQPVGPSAKGWKLIDGIPWPDPPDLVRSTPCDVKLQITELWRCGDAVIDQMRGIEPTIIELRDVPCPPKPKPAPKESAKPHGALATSVSALRDTTVKFAQTVGVGRLDKALRNLNRHSDLKRRIAIERNEFADTSQRVDIADVARRVRLGDALSRGALQNLGVGRGVRPAPRHCQARMLASPIFDIGLPVAFGNPAATNLVKLAWAKLGFKPSSLWNAVRVDTGSCKYAVFWLLVRQDLLKANRIVVRACGPDGKVLKTHVVTSADLPALATLPQSWKDTDGPWYEPLSYLAGFDPAGAHWPVLVRLDGIEMADRVEIGMLAPTGKKRIDLTYGLYRPFYVGAIEALRMSEVGRAAWDQGQTDLDHKVLDKALGLDSTAHALLFRDTEYTIHAKWTERLPGGTAQAKEASFTFKTDLDPPKRLDAWVLTSSPEEGEQHVFGAEKIAVVFATDDVARLWKGYHRTLRIRVKAASFRQVDAGIQHPIPIDDSTLTPVGATIVSPWEDAVAGLGLSCIGIDAERTRHAEIEIPIPLDPLTDYVIAIESVNDDDPKAPVELPLTIGFNTSAFATAAKFAEAFLGATVEHRHVGTNKLQLAVADLDGQPPHGTQFEALLEAAGLDAVPLPHFPRVVVLWEQDGAAEPQPVAVMIDGPEAIWRSRKMPMPETDPENGLKRTVMAPLEWLSLVETVNGAPATSLVTRVVSAPGGQRGLAMLSSARGKRVQLALRHRKLALGKPDGSNAPEEILPITDIWFAAAPWEDSQP